MTMIKQNFTQPNFIKLNDIEKCLTVNNTTFYLRGVINFHGGERSGLRSATGHYTCNAYRANSKWETYDDTKPKVHIQNATTKLDVEFLIYTV